MARIPDEEIERLKARISLERLAEAKGVKLKKHGADLMGLCPFHEDHDPSLVISPEKNLWHCLGACQAGGTVIDWVMRAEGVSFRHAVELLRADLPTLDAPPPRGGGRRTGPVVKKSTVQKLSAPLDRTASDEALMRQVVDYYHAALKESPEALEYLQKRGLNSAEMIEHFRLGFANRTLGYRLPQKNRQSGAELRGQLQSLGILRESGHEHFNGSIVIPVFDAGGRVTEMYGRKITAGLRAGTPYHMYLPGPHRGVWNEAALRSSKDVILCEALIDALTFWCAGFRNVTAAYGVEGFTDDHREAFRKYGTERVFIAYDRDEAGNRAAEKLAAELAGMGIEVFRVDFPKGMDANEFALKVKPAEKVFAMLLRQAWWMAGVKKGEKAQPATASELEPEPLEVVVMEPEPEAPPLREAEPVLVESSSEPEADSTLADERPLEPSLGQMDAAKSAEEASSEPARPEISSLREKAPNTSELATPTPTPGPTPAVMLARPGREPAPQRMTTREISNLAAELGAAVATEGLRPAEGPRPAPAASSRSNTVPAPVVNGDEVSFEFGDRKWRVRGLPKKPAPGMLRVNVLVSREGVGFHVDTLELYSARQRAQFTKLGSEELSVEEGVIKRDLGDVLLRLEEFLEKREKENERANKPRELSEAERDAALELLRDPSLLERILSDFERCGVVGERTNKLLGYLAATSRKLEEPLAVVIQSSSAAGKSSLMDAVLALMPKEERIQYSAMTGQSLFYMGEANLQHKILAIVEEEGAERASYALKLLQSEGELTIASTGKDPATGRLVTQEYHVEGPVMIFQTTTAVDMDEELLNRCIVLTVDEGREQTKAIHERQRRARTLEGMVARAERDSVITLHQNAQRLIRRLFVVNPYAGALRFPDHQTRLRRDHMKYLGLIEAVALLHQYQRPVKELEHRGQKLRYIEVTKEDIRVANRLAHEVLGRSLDELPPQTRRLLGLVDQMVAGECERLRMDRADFRFSRRQVRESTGWGDTQLKVHLGRLVELEYVIAHRGSGHSQRFGYELVYKRGESDGPFLPGLIGADELVGHEYDENRSGPEGNRSGQNEERSGSGRPPVGVESGGGRHAERGMKQHQISSIDELRPARASKPRPGNGQSKHAVALSSAVPAPAAVS